MPRTEEAPLRASMEHLDRLEFPTLERPAVPHDAPVTRDTCRWRTRIAGKSWAGHCGERTTREAERAFVEKRRPRWTGR